MILTEIQIFRCRLHGVRPNFSYRSSLLVISETDVFLSLEDDF